MITPFFSAVSVVVMRELIKFVRERGKLLSMIARPLLWLFLVGSGMTRMVSSDMGMPYIQFIFPGIVGMTVLFSSIFSSISIIWDKEFGFMKEMLVAPVPRSAIVVGKALSGTAVSTVQALIILLVHPFIGLDLSLGQAVGILLLSALLAFCLSSLGILIATFYESFESFSVIMNFIVMPMFFLSGAMYPVRLLPDAVAMLSKLNPLTYGVDALKHLSFRQPHTTVFDFTLMLDLSVLVICSFVFVIIGALAFERRK
ncbi:MAG TPA: ABC transporter permease [Dissulfurispiraceae bacterium]|nr:ABC transporter permease [Dissulfurispiraceae bacterium]